MRRGGRARVAGGRAEGDAAEDSEDKGEGDTKMTSFERRAGMVDAAKGAKTGTVLSAITPDDRNRIP